MWAQSPHLPGEEVAGIAMAGCWVAFYGVEKMLCGRQGAECMWQEVLFHPMLLTVSGGDLVKDTAELLAVLAGCNKLQENPDCPQRTSKAQVSWTLGLTGTL